MVPLIFYLGTNVGEWYLSRHGRPKPRKRTTGTSWKRRMGRTHNWSGSFGEDEISCPCPESKHDSSGCPARDLAQLSTKLLLKKTTVASGMKYLDHYTLIAEMCPLSVSCIETQTVPALHCRSGYRLSDSLCLYNAFA